MTGRTKRILHVEDEPDHALLIKRCLDRLEEPCDLVQVRDGEEALTFLAEHESQHSWLPDLILLDLRLPKIDGLEVLAELKKRERLQHIPVVVLTTSSAEGDVKRAAQNHANSYLVKPADLQSLEETMLKVESYWLRSDQLKAAGSAAS